MSETKHTPGPWRIKKHVDRDRDLKGTETFYGIAAGAQEAHETKGNFHPDDAIWYSDEHNVVEVSFDRDYGYPEGGIKSEANARLIAAAPDLLDAAENLLNWLREFHPDEPLFSADRDKQNVTISWLENAIRKAKGE